MALNIGDAAPDFTLMSDGKKNVSLSNYRGANVVLLFFPKAFTGVCTKELCQTRDDMAAYRGLNAEVLAISVDDEGTLADFKADQGYNFTLLSDATTATSASYGSLYDSGVSKRSAFVVDTDGNIRYAEVLENALEIPDFVAIKETLSGLV